jgi:hypothetical protein
MLDNFSVGAFLSLSGSKMDLSGVKLDPFRTTKSSTAVSQKKCCANHLDLPLKTNTGCLSNFRLAPFSALLVQNFTFPVSNLTHLGPLSPPPPCLKRSAAQTTWIYPLKPTLDACRIFVWPLSRPFWLKISPFDF